METLTKSTLWEEKNLTEQRQNSLNNKELEQNDTINDIKKDLTNIHLKDIGKISGIYKIVNKVNGKYYVGSSNHVYGRKQNHFGSLSRKKHQNCYLQWSWNKHGSDNFIFILVEHTNKENRILTEQKYLNIAKTERDKCYNLQFLATGGDVSDVTKKKMSESHKGAKNYNFGKPRSKETCDKIRIKNKLWKHTLEQKIKISKSKIGEKNSFFGKHHTQKAKEKIGLSRLGSKPLNTDKTIFNLYNKVTGEVYTGTKSNFIRKYKFSYHRVYCIINCKRTHHKNWCLIYPI